MVGVLIWLVYAFFMVRFVWLVKPVLNERRWSWWHKTRCLRRNHGMSGRMINRQYEKYIREMKFISGTVSTKLMMVVLRVFFIDGRKHLSLRQAFLLGYKPEQRQPGAGEIWAGDVMGGLRDRRVRKVRIKSSMIAYHRRGPYSNL